MRFTTHVILVLACIVGAMAGGLAEAGAAPQDASAGEGASVEAGGPVLVPPISFEFATREEGHELRITDVHLVIVRPGVGKLFEGVSEGPFLVASLPDGRYEVVASHEGRAQRVALTVLQGQPRTVTLYW